MAHDPGLGTDRHDGRIQADRDRELGCWAEELGVTLEELRSALEEFGPIPESCSDLRGVSATDRFAVPKVP
jgi:hypothetical protein